MRERQGKLAKVKVSKLGKRSEWPLALARSSQSAASRHRVSHHWGFGRGLVGARSAWASRSSLGGIEQRLCWLMRLGGVRVFDGLFDEGVIAVWERMTAFVAVERW